MDESLKIADESLKTAIVIPVFGRHDLTRAALRDLESEMQLADIWLVDNQGGFEPEQIPVTTLTPGSNLGWCRGCNYGVTSVWDYGYDAFILLNNDVRLSRSFIAGLLEAASATGGDVIGPLYDHNWPHQRSAYTGSAKDYAGRPLDHLVPFIDGTCMLIRRSTFESVGLLEERYWRKYSWGCDKDFALRVRAAGGSVWVTERSYLNHMARQTAKQFQNFSELDAERENDKDMAEKWGPDWRDLLYAGFESLSRLGMVQQRIQEEGI
jgi:GT2 family glycosyltransferase